MVDDIGNGRGCGGEIFLIGWICRLYEFVCFIMGCECKVCRFGLCFVDWFFY